MDSSRHHNLPVALKRGRRRTETIFSVYPRARLSRSLLGFMDAEIRRVICPDDGGSGASASHPSEAQECVIKENYTFLNNGRLSLPGDEVHSRSPACWLILSPGG